MASEATLIEQVPALLKFASVVGGIMCTIIGFFYVRDLRRHDSDGEKMLSAIENLSEDLRDTEDDLIKAQEQIKVLEADRGVHWRRFDEQQAEIRRLEKDVVRIETKCSNTFHGK